MGLLHSQIITPLYHALCTSSSVARICRLPARTRLGSQMNFPAQINFPLLVP
jgi:hypothetical protein